MSSTHDDTEMVNARELLGALAKAERHARDSSTNLEPNRSAEYRAGAADAYADAQTLVRKLAGLPVEADSDRM